MNHLSTTITTANRIYFSQAGIDDVDELIAAGRLIPAFDDTDVKVFISPYAVLIVREVE